MFPGKTLRKTNVKKKKATPKPEDGTKADKSADKPSSSTQADIPDELEAEKAIRKSTRTSVIVRQAEREAIRAEKEATAKVCTRCCKFSTAIIRCCNSIEHLRYLCRT